MLTKSGFLKISLLATFVLFIPILLNQGIFWDDWVIFHQPESVLLKLFTEAGNPLYAYLHIYLGRMENSLLIYRLVTLFASLASIFLLSQLLEHLTFFNQITRGYLLLLYAVLPFFASKLLMINVYSSLCLPLFLAGLLLFIRMNNNIILRICSLALFFLSFYINSFLDLIKSVTK